jgi:hypothetical protein
VEKKLKFAQHLLENKHLIGPMESVMDTIHITNKGRIMDTLEKNYIYRETKFNNQINDRLTVKSKAVFEAVVYKDPHRGHTSLSKPDHPYTTQS